MAGPDLSVWYYKNKIEQLVGPFSNQEILKLIMEGVIKVENPIFNSHTNEWAIAADVISLIKIEENSDHEPSMHTKYIKLPPRPQELKDVHVVDPNAEQKGQIDYFELINDIIKKNNEPYRNQSYSSAKRFGKDESQEFRESNSIKEEPSLNQTLKDGASFFAKFTSLLSQYNRPLVTAASLALVFYGTYNFIKSVSDNSSERNPASKNDKETKVENANTESVKAVRSENIKMGSDSKIGTGTEKVNHHSGGIKPSQPAVNSNRATPPPVENSNSNANETNSQAPQYYSSSEEPNNENQEQRSVANENQENKSNNVDINGAVNPPAYVMPPENSPNGDIPVNPEQSQGTLTY